jgi:hypothetical protein
MDAKKEKNKKRETETRDVVGTSAERGNRSPPQGRDNRAAEDDGDDREAEAVSEVRDRRWTWMKWRIGEQRGESSSARARHAASSTTTNFIQDAIQKKMV